VCDPDVNDTQYPAVAAGGLLRRVARETLRYQDGYDFRVADALEALNTATALT
jgi:hypothetical protein